MVLSYLSHKCSSDEINFNSHFATYLRTEAEYLSFYFYNIFHNNISARSAVPSSSPYNKDSDDMFPRSPQNVPSWAHDIIITCIIGPLVATIFVLIRVWTRIFVTHNIGWDDYAAIITLFLCISFSVVLGVSIQYGMGLHLYDVRFASRLRASRMYSLCRLVMSHRHRITFCVEASSEICKASITVERGNADSGFYGR